MSTGVSETVTSEEVAENNRFLDAVLETKVMKLAHQYLVGKKQARPDPKEFKTQLYNIWFQLYNRDRSSGADSCGFEHVFVGETKYGKEIMGLHNWIQFYLQEKHNHVDYKGYKARDNKSTPDEDDHVLSLQFSWKGLVKPVGSSFIGVSPEFEFAVYTIVFMMSQDKVTSAIVRVDEYQLELVVYRHGRCIGTSNTEWLEGVVVFLLVVYEWPACIFSQPGSKRVDPHSEVCCCNRSTTQARGYHLLLRVAYISINYYIRLLFCVLSRADSCGFEHVLVGETRSKQVIGFHNWIQFYLQEKQNHLNYRGNKARSNKHRPEEDQLLTFQFSCKDQLKPVRSSFIGVSPEFEFAVYTICFLMSHTHSVVKVDEYELELVVYRHGGCIGSSYPKLLSSNNTM
ncbi:ENDUB protein, partial [Polyodon spathula]|nr:ENDUB protein [Polyodon spathula]